MRRSLVLALVALASFAVTVLAFASLSSWQFHRDLKPAAQSPLPKIGPAPQFTLTSQAGMPVSFWISAARWLPLPSSSPVAPTPAQC